MTNAEVKEYKKRNDTILGIQWKGTLDEVPGISEWVLEQDPNATVNAKFTGDGLILTIQADGLLLSVKNLDYVVETDKGLRSVSPDTFLNLYEEVVGEIVTEEVV